MERTPALLICIKAPLRRVCDDRCVIAAHASPVEDPRVSRDSARTISWLPREHGSWALVLEPLVLAWIVAPSLRGAALGIACLAAFLARRPCLLWLEGRGAGFGQIGLILGVVVLLAGGWAVAGGSMAVAPALVVVASGAGILGWFELRRESRALAAELAAAVTCAAWATAIVHVAADRSSLVLAYAVGGFALARSLTSILPIRTLLRRRKGRTISGLPAMFAAGGAVVVAAMTVDTVGTWMLLVWSLVFAARTFWLIGPWAPRWTARRLGILEACLGLVAVVSTGVSLS